MRKTKKRDKLLEFSAARRTFFLYCIFNVWKLEIAVEAEVNLTFLAAMNASAYIVAASITRTR